MRDRVFVGEMAGAVGTLASQPEHGLETQERMFKILGLKTPTIAWHVARDNQAELPFAPELSAASCMKS